MVTILLIQLSKIFDHSSKIPSLQDVSLKVLLISARLNKEHNWVFFNLFYFSFDGCFCVFRIIISVKASLLLQLCFNFNFQTSSGLCILYDTEFIDESVTASCSGTMKEIQRHDSVV